MPFTPLHIGPALALGYFLRRRIHFPTFIVANIIVDVEPLIVLFFSIPGYPLHGYLHTFLFSILLGSTLGLVFYFVDRPLRKYFEYLALVEKDGYGVGGCVVAGVSGWALHVLLDTPLYSDIRPLYPLAVNPFYNPNLDFAVGGLCVLLLFVGSFLYLSSLYCNLSNKVGNMVAGVCTGLVATLLGLIAFTGMLLSPMCILLSAGLVFWGLLTFYNSLKRLDPSRRIRVIVSGIMMLTAASALSMLIFRSSYLRLTGEQLIGELFFHPALSAVLFTVSWSTSLVSIILLRTVLHRFSFEAGDRSFRLLVDLLIAGWVLMPVFIGALIVVPILLAILMKMPAVLAYSSRRGKVYGAVNPVM